MGLTEKIMKKFIEQCRKPTGMSGRLTAKGMNYGYKVTEWGLGHLSINQDYIILDVGCGGGKTVNRLAKIATEGTVYCIDYSEDCVKVASKVNKNFIEANKVEILHASVKSLPFPNNYFNLVTAVESYYFWPDLINNLKEIRQALKPGGLVMLINKVYKHEKFEKRNAKLAKWGNFSYHSPEEFRKFLKDAGYSLIKIHILEDKNWITAIGRKND